jgi:hypothetical protein
MATTWEELLFIAALIWSLLGLICLAILATWLVQDLVNFWKNRRRNAL